MVCPTTTILLQLPQYYYDISILTLMIASLLLMVSTITVVLMTAAARWLPTSGSPVDTVPVYRYWYDNGNIIPLQTPEKM